jgi:subtilisin family serine protease
LHLAHDAGIIVVVSAGNEGCNTKNYTPKNMPEAFVVGSTDRQNKAGEDRISSFSNVGQKVIISGTSFSAPYIAGIASSNNNDYTSIMGFFNCIVKTWGVPVYFAAFITYSMTSRYSSGS